MFEHSFEIDERAIESALSELLTFDNDTILEDCNVRTFEQAGVMTHNRGLVITMPDGSEFQLTIVQSR